MISKEGISIDPDKIKAIIDSHVPKDIIDVRSFMGIIGYYHKFIEGFLNIANLIISIKKKGKRFMRDQKCKKRFNKLKGLLTTTPILNIIDPDNDFVVCTDACNEGFGGILTQEIHVIAYESRKLKTHENNYATRDLELDAIIHALKMWRHHVISKIFLLTYDNISLKYLFDQQNLNARQSRWLALLSEYDFEIKHIKGKKIKWLMHLAGMQF